MKASTRLLVLAATTALMAPLATAQTMTANIYASAQSTTPMTARPTPHLPPPPALSSQASANSEALLNTNAPPPAQQLNESEPPPASEVEEEAMNPPGAKTAGSRGAMDAAAVPAPPAGRSWKQLDVDGDGRISAAEARADAGFEAGFGATDSNRDGFVSEAEFRAQSTNSDDDGVGDDRDE